MSASRKWMFGVLAMCGLNVSGAVQAYPENSVEAGQSRFPRAGRISLMAFLQRTTSRRIASSSCPRCPTQAMRFPPTGMSLLRCLLTRPGVLPAK